MAITQIIAGLAPVKLNTTVLPAMDVTFSPRVGVDPFRTSGDQFASIARVTGGDPAFRFRTPFKGAHDAIGSKFLKLTAFEVHAATFSDADRTATSSRASLAVGAIGFAAISGGSVSQNGVLMADVDVYLQSADGTTSPLVTGSSTVPSLVSIPTIHTIGPMVINSTTLGGLVDMGIQFGAGFTPVKTDGSLFPTAWAYRAGDPSVVVGGIDGESMASIVGMLGTDGEDGTGVVIYFREYDVAANAPVLKTTGMSLTIAKGRVFRTEYSLEGNNQPRAGLGILPISNGSAHPFVIAHGATIPTA